VTRPEERPPARLIEYRLPDGWLVLVGRTDADNDRLSLEIARPRDHWFHVRGMPGGHVVLRAREDVEPDRRVLERAASLAVWHSRGRGGGATAVTWTLARHVSKPGGAKPGTVAVRRERTISVRPPDPEDVRSWERETA
jgi:predicted ribosome quality control (RQC) complex YloA/Tae2 family protein